MLANSAVCTCCLLYLLFFGSLKRESFCHFTFSSFHLLTSIFLSFSADSTASIYVLRKGFSRLTQDVYYLPIEINDNGFPAMSSTNTLTIRVCSCDSRDTILSCNVEPYVLPAGLSTGALIAILACIVILLGKEIRFSFFFLFICYVLDHHKGLPIYITFPCLDMKFQLFARSRLSGSVFTE